MKKNKTGNVHGMIVLRYQAKITKDSDGCKTALVRFSLEFSHLILSFQAMACSDGTQIESIDPPL